MNRSPFSKFLAWVLSIAIALAIIPAVPLTVWAASDAAGTGWTFTAATGTLTVTTNNGTLAWQTGRGSNFELSDVKIAIIQNDVTGIQPDAFRDCVNLTSVTLPNNPNFTTISTRAFQGAGLESIVIPDSVTTISSMAFQDCTNLTSVTLPNNSNFTTIANSTFRNTGLTGVVIPDSVTTIEIGAFSSVSISTHTPHAGRDF